MSDTSMGGASFAGFPNGRLKATVVPSLFFSELLAHINDLAELKVVLYIFWRLGEQHGYPRFLTRRQLEGDPAVRAGLAGLAPDALGSSLDRLVARRVLLRRRVELHGRPEECYFLNTASGRKAVRDLESGVLDIGQVMLPEPEPPVGSPPRARIFDLYEQNVGLLTPLIVDELSEAERLYPAEWIEDAFREAVACNRRSWRYVQRILERWATEGRSDEAHRRYPSRARSSRAERTEPR
ncbi:MAG: DnaD domain protein [Chloroflexi bacterium]|nr:DnaD domain protein [Chloroflexota bacterium]